MTTMNLGQRLGLALDMLGWKASDLARASGVAAPTIRALVNRGSNRSEFLEQMLAALPEDHVNVEWVRSGQGKPDQVAPRGNVKTLPIGKEVARGISDGRLAGEDGLAAPLRSWEHPTELPPGDWVMIPRLGVLAPEPGSTGLKIVKLHEEVQLFRAAWIRDDQLKPSALTWAEAIDDSMEPVIFKGDHYVVDTSQTEIIDGAVYGIWFGGAVRPRRVHVLPTGQLRLRPLSVAYETVDIPESQLDKLQIVGRVVRREGKGGL